MFPPTHIYKTLLKPILNHQNILGNYFFIFPRLPANPKRMDRKGGCVVPKCCLFMKKTLQLLLLLSFSFFLYSYFSGFPFYFSYNLQLSRLIFPLFARALDRKYMFLVCNGIVVFLAKNLSVSSSTGIMKSAEDAILKEEPVRENAASMKYAINTSHMAVAEEEQTMQHLEQDYKDFQNVAEETKMDGIILESDFEEKEEDDDDYLKENKTMDGLLQVEEVNEASTEELNRKIEEFIRKMKEEIRIEAQQQLISVR